MKYLGSIGETHLANRAPGALVDFWDKANKALAELKEQGQRTKDINKIRASLSTKIKPPTQKDKRGFFGSINVPQFQKVRPDWLENGHYKIDRKWEQNG